MAKKMQGVGNDVKKGDKSAKSDARLARTVQDSAQQIWLAGLGAFAKAQEEGSKVFEALVKEGLDIQRKTQKAAQEKITEAATRMSSLTSELGSHGLGSFDKLESIFEERVAQALGKLGVPTAHDLRALQERMDALTHSLNRATAQRSAAATPRTTTARRSADQTPAEAAPPQTPVAAPGRPTPRARKTTAAAKSAAPAAKT
ncbi:phasin family protein [Extensimonas sp. H3M7-6]|nr:phasin family protein [Extensimonas sp. H3M7-6]MDF1480466.1 phasin family protein [Extensimonas sp. H3M7-6]